MGGTYRLVVVAPRPDADDLASRLSTPAFEVRRATSLGDAADHLEAADGAVVARALPEETVADAVEAVARRAPTCRTVVYAPDGDEDAAVAAFRAGAADYVTDPTALVDRVRRAVTSATDDGPGAAPAAVADHLVQRFGETPLATVEWDADYRIRRWDDAATDLFGYGAEEIHGRDIRTIVPDDERAGVEAACRTLIDEGTSVCGVNENVTAGGGRVLCEWYNAPITDGEDTVRVVSLVRNATDRLRQEQALRTLHEATRELMGTRDTEEIFEIAVRTLRDVLSMPLASGFEYDAADDLLRPVVNTTAATETFGPPPTFEVGEGVAGDVFATGEPEVLDDAVSDERADVPPDSSFAKISSYMVMPLSDYGMLTVADTEVGAFDDRGVELVKTLAANTESALERAEGERELARQNERLDRFASVVGHDLRNPLAVARGNVERLRVSDDADEEVVETVDAALERMDELLDGLLTLARDGETVDDPGPTSVESVARSAWETVDSTDATLTVADDPVVEADESRLRQLFENLFRNALEHGSTSSGEPSVAGAPDETVSVTVGALPDGGFYVADDGPGIPEADRETVFDSGVSGAGGNGLGLAIVERIAEAHGWRVEITASDAGGARIEVGGN